MKWMMLVCVLYSVSIISNEKESPKTPLSIEFNTKTYKNILGMPGFSDDLLNMHFTLYAGYVRNTCLLEKEITALQNNTPINSVLYGALKRRLAWEFNGMRLHEMYFENLGGIGDPALAPDLLVLLKQQFGSYESWKKDFMATGLIRGIGWVILCRDNATGKLLNIWINEHDVGQLGSSSLLLVMDVWEHAYITEYGLDRGKYIQAFFANIDWGVVGKRERLK